MNVGKKKRNKNIMSAVGPNLVESAGVEAEL